MKRTLLVVMAFAFALAACAAPRPQKGHLVIIGGGTITGEILGRMTRYAGGPRQARILIVPYAMREADYLERNIKVFRDYGCTSVDYINVEPAEVDRPENLAKLDGVNVVFFSGGQQRELADALRGTRFLERIHELHAAGATITGTSAGAAVMSKAMIAGGHRQVPPGKDPATWGVIARQDVNLVEGFGFMPEVIIHQHFVVRKRLTSLFSALLDRPDLSGVGIDESTAIDVSPDGTFEVVGDGTAMVIRPRHGPLHPPRFEVVILWKNDTCKYRR